jgi:predicted transcriptional regulator
MCPRVSLSPKRRALLEFLAVAEGFVHISELSSRGLTWGSMMQQVEYLRHAGLVIGLADHVQISALGRTTLGLAPLPAVVA